ncbi:TadE/TadG family type IV pilus assembly protein [Pelagibius sp. 7325]|uniref:TadE/TadG family type IV pilus assembly protein n=1 Tax=Pelagibius sp. 7325 TaxID=3131994 RepID=UPI0030EE91D7
MFFRAVINRVGRAVLPPSSCSAASKAAGAALRRCAQVPLKALSQLAGMPLARDQNGNVLIEFALVTPLFVLLIVGTLEVSVMFFTSSVIEGATVEAARQIRTGQVQESGDPITTFQNRLCDSLFNVIDCSEVKFNVKTFSSFGEVSMPIEIDEDGEIVNNGFTPGESGAVTVVRSLYRWEFMTPLISNLMPVGLGGHLIVSTVAFQNEPYDVN